MTISTSEPPGTGRAPLEERLRSRATALGIDELRIAPAVIPQERSEAYLRFLDQGRHGTMDWLARDPERRAAPRALWAEARSAVVCGLNYAPESDPLAALDRTDRGSISVYARNRDYHDILKGRLKQLAGWLHKETRAAVKVFVDTAPILEKPLAERAGMGWQGKHTNLVSRRFGSWLFLGEILTEAELCSDEPEHDHCGNCRRCLDICPTDAFPTAHELDARRCISYLTIEHRGPIPSELADRMGNRIYGCDDCLAVCPWNKFASAAREAKLQARADLEAPDLARLAALDDPSFRRLFSGSPIKRIGRERFLRNVLVAIGNSGDERLVGAATPLLDDPSPLLRAAAIRAIALLAPADRLGGLLACIYVRENHPWARAELDRIDSTP